MSRRTKKIASYSALVLLACGGCGEGGRSAWATSSLRSIVEADRVVLYSIDFRTDQLPADAERFHNYPVLGTIDISDAGARGPIVSALRDGIARCRVDSGFNCFWPRHGIRAERGGKAVDYVICFECAQIEVYDDAGSKINYLLTTDLPQSILDQHLTAAGVPLPPPKN